MGISSFLVIKQQTTVCKMKSFAVFAAVLATAAAIPQTPYHPAPIHPAPAPETPKPYAFEYGVEDSYSGAAFGQTETSDTKVVTGNYRVALPDGRTQIVDYTADPYGAGGYVADVKYDGVAHFPEHAPVHGPVHPVIPHRPVIAHPVVAHAPVVAHPVVAHPVVHTAPIHPIHG